MLEMWRRQSFRGMLQVWPKHMVVAELSNLDCAKRAIVKAKLGNKNITFLLDLGANVNILPTRLVPDKVDPSHNGNISVF
ncbi:Uncharacterized protein FKW44_006823, partial [Caligus rogercresseyi]